MKCVSLPKKVLIAEAKRYGIQLKIRSFKSGNMINKTKLELCVDLASVMDVTSLKAVKRKAKGGKRKVKNVSCTRNGKYEKFRQYGDYTFMLPPFPANKCCNRKIMGNDRHRYVSRKNKKGVCRWKKMKRIDLRGDRPLPRNPPAEAIYNTQDFNKLFKIGNDDHGYQRIEVLFTVETLMYRGKNLADDYYKAIKIRPSNMNIDLSGPGYLGYSASKKMFVSGWFGGYPSDDSEGLVLFKYTPFKKKNQLVLLPKGSNFVGLQGKISDVFPDIVSFKTLWAPTHKAQRKGAKKGTKKRKH